METSGAPTRKVNLKLIDNSVIAVEVPPDVSSIHFGKLGHSYLAYHRRSLRISDL